MYFSNTSFTTLLVYVDDMIITGNDLAYVAKIKPLLDQKFGNQRSRFPQVLSRIRDCKKP